MDPSKTGKPRDVKPLTPEHRELWTKKKKGRNRNHVCPCNSGKKFKHCCWNLL